MPNNHSKYRIPGNVAGHPHRLLPGSRALASAASPRGGFRGVGPPGRNCGPRRSRRQAASRPSRLGRRPASSRNHRGARVHTPGALVGKTLDFQTLAAEKLFDGAAGLVRPDTGQGHVPVGRLKWEGCQRRRCLGHLDHVHPIRQGRVEPLPDFGSGAPLPQRQLQVLGLARRPRRSRACIGNLRVGCEALRKSDGQPGPANSPLNSTRDVPVAGETHPASFSVPDNQTLGGA